MTENQANRANRANGANGAGAANGPRVPMTPYESAYEGREPFASASKPPLVRRYLPFVRSVRGYTGARFRVDAIAGLTVAAVALPASMAYAELAGVPVTAGLYALLLPVVAYAILGSAPRLVIGAEGTVSLLIASALGPIALAGSPEYATLAMALAVAVGAVFLAARLMRLGWIADYFSQSVLVGYITGVAVLIILGQVGKLVGMSSDYLNPVRAMADIVAHLGQANPATAAVGLGALVLLFAFGRFAPRAPGALIVVVLAIATSWLLDLGADGVGLTGPVPAGLPTFALPGLGGSDYAIPRATPWASSS